jgi:hypothetical protein
MTTPKVWPPALDWKDSKHWDFTAAAMDAPSPCVLCGKPSLLLSDDGKPCHKTCAEAWFEQHPQAWAAYEEQRDTKKDPKRRRNGADVTPISAPVNARLPDAA